MILLKKAEMHEANDIPNTLSNCDFNYLLAKEAEEIGGYKLDNYEVRALCFRNHRFVTLKS